MSNACAKFEERSLNLSKVIALTKTLWRGGGRVADENIIFPETCVSREYNEEPAHETHSWDGDVSDTAIVCIARIVYTGSLL